MKGIILYKSKYGATKKYADWLAQETDFDCIETSKAKIAAVKEYDVIILGGGIYAMGIAGLSFLKKNLDALEGKKIAVFCDGASPFDEEAFEEIKKKNMVGSLKDIPLFYCRGMWNMDAMNLIDRNLCKMLLSSVAKKDPGDCAIWEKALKEAGNNRCDWTDKVYLEPIMGFISQAEQE